MPSSSSYRFPKLGLWVCRLVVVTFVCVMVGVGSVEGKVFCPVLLQGVVQKLLFWAGPVMKGFVFWFAGYEIGNVH